MCELITVSAAFAVPLSLIHISPVNIRGIKRFAVDQVPADQVAPPPHSVDTARNIAVVGGGPSGLTCAYFLALMGHRVTVFEARSQLGGMLRYGIPAYRLPVSYTHLTGS